MSRTPAPASTTLAAWWTALLKLRPKQSHLPHASPQIFDYSNDVDPGRALLILNPQKSQQHSPQEKRGAPELFESLSILHLGRVELKQIKDFSSS